MAGSQVALAIVPTGTGNLLAGNLDIPHRSWRRPSRTRSRARLRTIDVGQVRIGGKRRAFTVACGVGFDADVMERTDSEEKGRWGKLAYLANALRESGNIAQRHAHITLDGKRTTTEAAQVLVANSGRIGPGSRPVASEPTTDCSTSSSSVHPDRCPRSSPAGRRCGRPNPGRERQRPRPAGPGADGRVETNPRRRVETDGSAWAGRRSRRRSGRCTDGHGAARIEHRPWREPAARPTGARSAAGRWARSSPIRSTAATPDERGVTQLVIGFSIALVALIVFAFLADRIYHQEAFCARHGRQPVPARDLVADARRGHERHHDHRLRAMASASCSSSPWASCCTAASRRGPLPGGRHRWQRRPERDHEARRRTASAGAALGERAARLQLPERPHDELAGVLPRRSHSSSGRCTADDAGRSPCRGVLVTAAIGFSRVYLGYHYVSDVVGGLRGGPCLAVRGGPGVRDDPSDLGAPARGPASAATGTT